MLPKVKVVVLTWDRPDLASVCIQSVEHSSYPNVEILVVENGSTTESVEALQRVVPGYELLWLRENVGFVDGYNAVVHQCAANTETKYLLILSNDTKLDYNAIEEAVEFMESHPSVGILQPKLLYMDSSVIDATGILVNPLLRHVERGKGELDIGQYDGSAWGIFSAKAAAFFVRSELISAIGFFDDSFYVYYEGIDLAWRAWLAGYKVAYCGQSVIYHHMHSPTASKREDESVLVFHHVKNCLRMMLKNYGTSSLWRWLPLTVAIDVRKFLLEILAGRYRHARAIASAYRWTLMHWRNTMELRGHIQRGRKMSDEVFISKHMMPLLQGLLCYRRQGVEIQRLREGNRPGQ